MRAISISLVVSMVVLGCSERKPTEPSASQEAAIPTKSADSPVVRGDQYRVRGEVRDYDETAGQLAVHHESIPTFKSRIGEQVGMAAMQMTFRVAEGVDAKSLSPGDKITMDFVVDWDEAPPIEIIGLSKLPPETVLDI
jgi:Cu/Ag efflux protein CusF